VDDEMDQRPTNNDTSLFHFEAKWLEEENCDAIVHNAWLNADTTVAETLCSVADEVKCCSKQSLGYPEKRIAQVKKELEVCRRCSICQNQVDREHILRYKLEKMETQWDIY
jgi:hypothetical protein